jgi:hypothetical protein
MRAANRSTLAALLVVLAPRAASGTEAPPPDPAPSSAAPAEWRPWSLSLGTGAGGYVEFVDAFSNGGPGGYDSSQRSNRLQLNVRADHLLDRWFRVGLAWTYNRWTDTYFTGGTETGSIDNQVHTLLADVTLRWYRAEHVELYSALAAGAGRWSQAGTGIGTSQDGVQSGFAFQLRYLGINAGNDRLRAFVELGLGFEGLLVGGLTLRF